ncbi:MAG: BrnT family toxin [Treponema sp.]|nr:BrnT family toxin [Treponema sp.]
MGVESVEWDNAKADANEKKHEGLTFEEAAEVFDDPFALEKYDGLHSTAEESRYIVIGRIKRQVVTLVVYTPRGEKRRIISARYATSNERKAYYDRLRKIYSSL